jgi:hypothetical protein
LDEIEKLELIQNEAGIREKMAKIDTLDFYVRTELMTLITEERNQ